MVTKQKNSAGFSLIELLIVIAIVGTIGTLIGTSMMRLQRQAYLDDATAAVNAQITKRSSDSKRHGKTIWLYFAKDWSKVYFYDQGWTIHQLPDDVYIKDVQIHDQTVSSTYARYLDKPNGTFEIWNSQNNDLRVTLGRRTNNDLEAAISIIGVTGRVILE